MIPNSIPAREYPHISFSTIDEMAAAKSNSCGRNPLNLQPPWAGLSLPPMEIRAMTPHDLARLADIDSTSESAEYLHVDRSGEGMRTAWKIEPRPLREKRTARRVLDDEQRLTVKQIVSGAEEGMVLVAEHDSTLVGSAAARLDPASGVMRIVDLRVDFDFRRQGLASAMMFQIIQEARQRELRAVWAEASADNFPLLQLLVKLGFEPTGLDTHFRSNHDLVKETVVLFWYLTLN
jgi:ribosomal protein S18 acetylase RimI-like enzyme